MFSNLFLKLAKRSMKELAEKEWIPLLQKKINAGAIDKKVDALIKEGVLECIDQIGVKEKK